jgi:hypothetical protein
VADLRWEWFTSRPQPCTSAEPRTARRQRILSLGTNSGHSGGSSANRSRNLHTCSPQKGARRSQRLVSPAWSSAQVSKRSLGLRPIPTCADTPVVTRLPTGDTIPVTPGLPRASQHPAHCPLHRTVADAVRRNALILKIQKQLFGAYGTFSLQDVSVIVNPKFSPYILRESQTVFLDD